MQPTQEMLDFWLDTMRHIKGLTALNMQNLKTLLEGLVCTAFLVPLLRRVVVEDRQCIAHMGFHIEAGHFKNSLEQTPHISDLRARVPTRGITDTHFEMLIEQYVGEKHVSEQNQQIQDQGGGLLPWHALALAQDFSNSDWKHIKAYQIREFKKLEVVERTDELWHNTPTFDLILTP